MTKVLSAILLIFVTPIFLVILFLFSLKLTILNPSFVKKELTFHNAYAVIYKNIPEIVGEIVPVGKEGPDADPGDSGKPPFSPEETAALFYSTVTEQSLRDKTEAAVDSIWPWIFGGKELKNISIQDIKDKLSMNIMDSFRKKYDALPYCKKPSDFQYDIETCRLYGVSFDQLIKEYQLKNTGNADTPLNIVGNIPSEINIEGFTRPNSELSQKFAGAQDVRSKVSPIFGNIYLILGGVTIVALFLSRLFAGSWQKTPKVFGIYVTVVASVFFLMILTGEKLLSPMIVNIINGKVSVMPNIKTQLIVPMTRSVFVDISAIQAKISFFMFGIGLFLTIGSWIAGKYIIKKSKGSL